MQSRSALILGGGVIGLSTAYHLARKGFGQITVLEKDRVGAGASSRAAGIVTGLLWSEAGVLARKLSLQRYRELSDELPGYTFQAVGALNLFDPPSWPERAALLPLYDQLGAPYEILDAAEIHQRWPALTPPVETTGLYDPLGGYSEPDDYVPALARACRELGVTIHEQTPVTGLVEQGGRITGVETTGGPVNSPANGIVEADVVIVTVHAWMGALMATVGRSVPVKAFVHQRYVTTPLAAPVQIPAVNANPQGGYLRPAAGNRILAGGETTERAEVRVASRDFDMGSLAAPTAVRPTLTANMTPLLPCLGETQWAHEAVGLICFSLDGEPILGPVAELPGLYLGCAFHSGGFAYSPAAGLLLAEWVADGRPSLDINAFSPARFGPAEVDAYLATTVTQAHAVRRRH